MQSSKGYRLRGRFTFVMATTIAVVLPCLALALWQRRLSGSLERGPRFATCFAIAVLIVIGFSIARALVYRLRIARRAQQIMLAAVSFSAWSLAAVLSLPGTAIVSLLMIWGALAIEEGWWWNLEVHSKGADHFFTKTVPVVLADKISLSEPVSTKGGATLPISLEGTAAIEFAREQRTLDLHLAFNDRASAPRELHAEPIDESPLTIKVVTLQPFGAHLEIRRSGDCSVPLMCEVAWEAVWEENAV